MIDFESGDPDRMRRLLALGTDIILPLECGRQLSGQNSPEKVLAELAKITTGQLVVTDGIHGSWGLTKAAVIHRPALQVTAKIDSTGCGDAYHAGYIVGLLEGWALEERMEFGTWLASRVIGKVGGRTALPKRKDLLTLANGSVSALLQKHLILLSKKS